MIEITVSGETTAEVIEDYRRVGRDLLNLEISAAGGGANGHDANPEPSPPQTRRRRSRDAAAAAPEAEAEVEQRETLDSGELRTKVIDILQQCYRHSKEGAGKVVDLQKEYKVHRFAEVPDGQLSQLYSQATALQNELNGTAPPAAADTGPF
jgi:hypothetical protein